MADDDSLLFTQEMQGVRRIQVNQADTGKRRSGDQKQTESRRRSATEKTLSVDALSDHCVVEVAAEEALLWAGNGLQDEQLGRLKKGQIAFEGELDLHGFSIEKARQHLSDFFAQANQLDVRCVRVIHGKASAAGHQRPRLKSHVNSWLRQHPQVLGFCSCLPRHGGTGAVYVLLRRQQPVALI